MNKPKVINQHYIPQCLLKYFSNAKGQVFEALVESSKVYTTNYRNSMSERYAYEHPDIEENKVEKYFSNIESYIGVAVQTIIDTIEAVEKHELELEAAKHVVTKYLSEFIVFYYRSGALLTEFEFDRPDKSDRVLLMLDNILNSKYISELKQTVTNYYQFAII